MVEKAQCERLLRTDQIPGQQQFHGLGEGHLGGHAHGGAAGRDQCPFRLLHAEFGFGDGNANVRALEDFHAAGDGVAVDGGDDRLFRVEVAQQGAAGGARVRQQPFVPLVLRLPRPGEQRDEPPQVRTGAEGGAGAGQHGNPHLRIVTHLPPSLVKAHGHLGIDGVAHLRAIEGDEGDMPPPFVVEHRHGRLRNALGKGHSVRMRRLCKGSGRLAAPRRRGWGTEWEGPLLEVRNESPLFTPFPGA